MGVIPECLEIAVRALAQPASVQLELFPRCVCIADELALNFEAATSRSNESFFEMCTQAQIEAISALDNQISSMSGANNARFWTEKSLQNDKEWEFVRQLARAVLTLMRWQDIPPPPCGNAIYVGKH